VLDGVHVLEPVLAEDLVDAVVGEEGPRSVEIANNLLSEVEYVDVDPARELIFSTAQMDLVLGHAPLREIVTNQSI
jgi:hypothetical protein